MRIAPLDAGLDNAVWWRQCAISGSSPVSGVGSSQSPATSGSNTASGGIFAVPCDWRLQCRISWSIVAVNCDLLLQCRVRWGMNAAKMQSNGPRPPNPSPVHPNPWGSIQGEKNDRRSLFNRFPFYKHRCKTLSRRQSSWSPAAGALLALKT